MTLLTKHHRRKLVKVVMGAEKERAGKLSDDKLIEHFVTTVLNGLPTGSYEEALAKELVDRFSAVVGIEVNERRSE